MSGNTDIGIRLRLDGAQAVSTDLSRVEASLGKMATGVQRLGQLGAALLALPAALNSTVGSFVRAGDAVTVLNNQLKLATGSMASAQQAYGALFDIAQRSRVSFTELGGTFASISRATSELGIGQNRLLTVTEAIGNAMAISGGNAQGMQAALTQLGQGFASGTLRGEELNSVMEQTPRLAKAIADGLGITIGQLRAMGQEGKLTGEAVIGALESQAKVLAGEVKDSVVTVSQSMTQLGNAAVALAGQIDKSAGATHKLSGLAQAAANDLGRLSSAMTLAEKAGAGFVDQIGAAAGVAVGRSAFEGINTAASKLNQTLNYLTGGMAGLNETVRVMPLALQTTAEQVGTLERSLSNARAQWEQLRAQGEREGRNIYLRSAMGDLEAYIARTEVALQNTRRLQGEPADSGGAGRGSVNPQTVGARAKEEADAQAKLNELRSKALGVNKELTQSLIDLDNAARVLGLSESERIKLAQALTAQAYKSRDAHKAESAELDRQRDIAKEWADTIEGAQKIIADNEAATLGLTKAQALMIQYLQAPAYLEAGDSMREVALQTLYAAHNSELATAADKARAKALDELDASAKKYLQTLGDQAAAAEREAQSLRDQVVEITYGKAAREALVQQRLDDAAAQAQQIANAARWMDGAPAEIEALQRLADKLRDVAEARRGLSSAERAKEDRDAQAEAARKAADEWDRTADSIRDGLTDAFRRAFESGEDFGTAMAKVIERELKARIATALSGMLADGVLALGALAVESMSAGGSDSPSARAWISKAKDASTLYDWGTKAYNWYTGAGSLSTTYGTSATIGGTVAQSSATKAALYSNMGYTGVAEGTAATSTGAAGASSGSWGAAAGYAALIAAAIVASDKAYDRGFTGSDQLSGKLWYEASIENATRSVLSKLGVNDKWAEILSGSVALNDSFGYSQARVEAAGVQGTLGAGDFTGQSFADIKSKAGWVRKLFGSDDRTSTELAALPTELGNFLDDAAKSVFDQAKEFGEALGLPAQALAGITTDIKVALTDDIEANKAEIAKALGTYGDALVGSWAEAVKPLAQYGETTAQTIQRVGGAIVGVNAVLDTLGIAALQAGVDGGKAALALQSLFGGQQGLEQATGSYLQNFYTDAERTNLTLAGIGKTLGEVGLAVPATREAFRELVDAQNLMTPAGQAAFAALMKVEGAFAAVVPAAESAAEAAADLAGAIADALPRLVRSSGPYADIQQQLAGAGVSVSIAQLMGATRDDIYAFAESFLSLEAASHDSKIAVVRAAGALGDLKTESERTAAGLNLDLLRALGREQEAIAIERRAELDALRALDPALASVKESIYAAIDAADAASRIESIMSGVDSVASDFLSGSDLSTYLAERIQGILADGGIDASVPSILGATRDQILELWRAVGVDGKEAILAAYGPFKDLDELLHGLGRRVLEYRTGTLADSIENARLGALSPQARVAALKSTEEALFGQLATADDPVAVAERLQDVVLRRIGEEATLREQVANRTRDSLHEQLDAVKRLKGLSQEIGQFTATLAFGDLSPLSRRDQVAAAESLFDATLDRARRGDEFARANLIGNARAYLEEAVSAFASGPQSAAIYGRVTAALDEFGLSAGSEATPQIAALQAQIDNLPDIADNTAGMLSALLRIDTALGGRDGTALSGLALDAPPDVRVTQGPDGAGSGAAQTAQTAQMTAMVADATRTANNTAALLAAAQEGFAQAIRELRQANSQRAQLLTEMQVGRVPA